MSIGPDIVLAPPSATVRIALEPAYNGLTSLLALTNIESHSGLDEWVVETAATLSPQQKETNLLLFAGLGLQNLVNAVGVNVSWPTYPAFVEELAGLDAVLLRDRLLHLVSALPPGGPPAWEPSASLKAEPAALLADTDAYVGHMRRIHQSLGKKGLDETLHTRVHQLLNGPTALKELLVSHLGQMWDEVLATEWAHIAPTLQDAVAAFQKLDYTGLTSFEAIRAVTGRDLSGTWIAELVSQVHQIVFVPSIHTGPYVVAVTGDGVMRLVFGARLPQGGRAANPSALGASELLRRLNALADKTRPNILLLLRQHDELCSQDIIDRFDLSQSTASRHLRQLSATGFLRERRLGGARKCYHLDVAGIEDTLETLARFLKEKGTL